MTPSFNIRSSGSWAISHLNLNKDKQQLPVLLHFHFSRERIALAGAKNAKALAWNRGNLVERERRDGDILWGHCSGVAQTTFYWVIQLENRRISHQKKPKPRQRNRKTSQAKDTTPHQLPEVMSQVIAGARHCRQGHKMDTELGNRVLNMQLSPSQLSEAAGSIPSLCMTPSTLIFKYMCQ